MSGKRWTAQLERNSVPEPNTGCILWLGSLSDGYGRLCVSPGSRTIGAHRLAYELEHGPIPVGQEIDHLCRVRSCVNVAHMEAVPKKVNILRGDGFAAKNARKGHCPRGHAYSSWNGRRRCLECNREVNRVCYRKRVAR